VKYWRKTVNLLLVLVMLGSIVSPALAASNNICCIEQGELTEKEKKKDIAKAFADKGVQKFREKLIKMGFKLKEIKVRKVNLNGEYKTVVTIFFERGNDVAVLSYAGADNVFAGVLVDKELTIFKYDPLSGDISVVTLLSLYDLCVDLCNTACAIGCAAGCGELCSLTGWFAPICVYIVCPTLCYLIGKYGCDPGCNWLCDQIT